MKYVGSKNRLAKEIVPIIESYITDETEAYVEPFVGGANIIDKVTFHNKLGFDSHEELIELLEYASNPNNVLPDEIPEDEYIRVRDNKSDYPKWYVGLVGFASTYSAKYFGGYARSFMADKTTPRNMSNEGIRNIERQRPNLEDIKFTNDDFRNIKVTNAVIYCDPPYKGTLKYSTNDFPYEDFYNWCRHMSEENIVIVSEYNMPDDFECIWEKEHKVLIDSAKSRRDKGNVRVEKLFILKGGE